jgi:hypothetical protein
MIHRMRGCTMLLEHRFPERLGQFLSVQASSGFVLWPVGMTPAMAPGLVAGTVQDVYRAAAELTHVAMQPPITDRLPRFSAN